MDSRRSGREHADPLVANLPAVAVRAVQHLVAPALAQPVDLRQVVDEPGRHQQPPRGESLAAAEQHLEPVAEPRCCDRTPFPHLAAVAAHFLAPEGDQIQRRQAVPGQHVVDAGGGGVARSAGVDDEHQPPRAQQCDRTTQAGGATPDDDHVVLVLFHPHSFVGPLPATLRSTSADDKFFCRYGKLLTMEPTVDSVLDAVGPRLRALRLEKEMTLADLASSTGISVSTLSRLESGGRRPTLELLLPIARAHGLALDDLVEVAAPSDPRVRQRPVTRGGMTMVPLSRRAGRAAGLQADHPARAPATASGPEGA